MHNVKWPGEPETQVHIALQKVEYLWDNDNSPQGVLNL